MNNAKRKLSCNYSYEERTKKLRNEIDQWAKMSIENLSNEILYEILDYLDGCDVHQAFSNLNKRFQNLLNSSFLLFKIRFDHPKSKNQFVKNFKQILLLHKSQIFSIHFFSLVHETILWSLNIDSSFHRLESFVIHSIAPNILIPLLINLTHLPRFYSLTIDIQKTLKDLTDIYQLIFNLPKLKYLRFFAMEANDTIVTVSLPTNINKVMSNTKYLVIDHPIGFNELFSLISYTSQLIRLSFIHKIGSSLIGNIISPIILSNLTHLSIYGDQLTFNEFEIFIRKIPSKLKILSVKSLAKDMTYLNGDRWKEFLLKSLPQLETFYLICYVFFNYTHEIPLFNGKLNRFNSRFWIERQWLLEAEINLDNIIYSIHPYKKRWYQSDETIHYPSKDLAKSMRIVIQMISYYDDFASLKQCISQISAVAEIYHLEINEEIYTDVFLEILSFLPDVHSFQILSLPYSTSMFMTDEDRRLHSSLMCQNQIRKIYLKKITNIEESFFLIDLCPHMTYFKVNLFNYNNMELFVRLILMKINKKSNQQLRLLCFHIKAADDLMIDKLNKMIRSEKLLRDCTIKRIIDEIYLEWKSFLC